jgi:hypothetical protein
MGTATTGSMNGMTIDSSGLFVAVGTGSFSLPVSAYSYNGTTWSTPVTMSGFSSIGASDMMAVAVSSGGTTSGKWIAVGQNSSSVPVFATSSDGISWTGVGTFGSGSGGVSDIAVNSSGTFAVVGPAGYSYSTNGTTWTTFTAFTGSVTITAISVDTYGTGFIAVGYETSGGAPVYTTSSSGTSWTTPVRMNASSTTAYLQGITVNQAANRYVVVGFDSSNAAIYSYTTSAGSIWQTPARMNGSASNARMRDVIYNSASDLYVAVGDNSSTLTPVYATSVSGTTWITPALIGSAENVSVYSMNNVKANSSGLFSCVGSGSKIVYSYATFP